MQVVQQVDYIKDKKDVHSFDFQGHIDNILTFVSVSIPIEVSIQTKAENVYVGKGKGERVGIAVVSSVEVDGFKGLKN